MGMKLELTIADDRELRDFIKDNIKGEIVSIARGEIKGILASVVHEGVIPTDPKELRNIVKDEISKLVRDELGNSSYGSSPGKIQQIAREEVRKLLKELLTKGSIVG